MNPRRPYNPDRRKTGSQGAGSLWIFVALPLIGATLFFIFRPRAAAPQPTPFDVSSTPPPATLPATDILLPTVTPTPSPEPVEGATEFVEGATEPVEGATVIGPVEPSSPT